MATSARDAVRGTINRLHGHVIDVDLPGASMPAPGTLLRIARVGSGGEASEIRAEVACQLGPGRLRAIAFGATEGLTRQSEVWATFEGARVPVGPAVLGRHVDVHGAPIDGKGPIEGPTVEASWSKGKATRGARQHTGIKPIDLFAPLAQGGTLELWAPQGTGAYVNINELLMTASMSRGAVGVVARPGGARPGEASMIAELEETPMPQGGTLRGQIALVSALFDDAPLARARVQLSAYSIATGLVKAGREVLLVELLHRRRGQASDEVAAMLEGTPGCEGYLEGLGDRDRPLEGEGALSRVRYIEREPPDPEQGQVALDGCDAVVALSPREAALGIYPPVDPLTSTSALLTPEVVGDRHVRVAAACRAALARYRRLLKTIANVGMEHLSTRERTEVARARKLQRFMSQPYFVAAMFTGIEGKSVPIEETLRGCEAILGGEVDDLNEASFYMVGTLDDARAKAARWG